MRVPQLSIIIPVLNEAESLPLLLSDIVRQQNISFEIIVVDGGSSDASCTVVQNFIRELNILIRLIHCPAGRGLQMNNGASAAVAADLLFLHADTRITNQNLLSDAAVAMQSQRASSAAKPVAGHFGLGFSGTGLKFSNAYYYYEAKTRLNRIDCINGDQGLWISRQYFNELGQFDETLSYMEDIRLANKIFMTGEWINLPGSINTSARRFETEGLVERQTLNALISNFENIGVKDFFSLAKKSYQQQIESSRLDLRPFFKIAHHTLFIHGLQQGFINWYKTGCYVAQNVWQLPFAIDCSRNRKKGQCSGNVATRWLDWYDNWPSSVMTSIPGKVFTTIMTVAWFYGSWFISRRPT